MATNFMTTKFDKWLNRDVKTHKKGVTLIHLFHEVWRTGKLNEKKDKPAHLVIYDPHDKQYDVYGQEALDLMSAYTHEFRGCMRVDPAKVKIYILSSILDKKENWCFNLSEKPAVDAMIKVIYNNGTIKVIKSTGNWEPEVIDRKYSEDTSIPQTIYPVAYKCKQ